MLDPSLLSYPALALAGLTVAGMVVAGVNPWLVLAVAILWTGSLWLARPAPEMPAAPIDARQVSSDAILETIEPLGQPLLLVDGTRIAVANEAARAAMGDHIAGQDARIALRHPDAVRLIDMSDGESVTIPGFTGGRSLWQLTRRNLSSDKWMIELTDRTAESDVGRAHTDFVANASHELRTPLASVIGYVETLAEDQAAIDGETRTRFLGIVAREANRMLALVEDLLTLSHLEAEKHDRPNELIDLSALVARVVGEIASLQGKERVEFQRAGEDMPVYGDSGQLEQLLRNLIDNALKYGAPDQPVVVSLAQAEGGILLAVADHGPGIAPEHLPHLTRRFYRTDPGRSRASGGTGLGLAIVKHIVERHRATLEIASTVGEGTRVTVRFPANSRPAGIVS